MARELRTFTKFYVPRNVTTGKRGKDVFVLGVDKDVPSWSPPIKIPSRYIGLDSRKPSMFKDSIGEGPFQITYAFPWDTRNNITGLGKYGVDGMTFARLYDFLCTAYNHGERFVDTYFQKQFPNSAAGRLFRAVNLELRDGVDAEYGEKYASALRRKATKEGRPNMTTTEGIQLKKFSVFRAGHTKSELKRLRGAVKAEIVQYLSTGSIQLKFTGPSPLTLLRRAAAGITSSVGFYATGQLINSIQLDIRLPEESLAA